MVAKKKNEDELELILNLFKNTLDEIYEIFENKKREKYAEGVLLMSSIIEHFLRALILDKLTFSKIYPTLSFKEMDDISKYCDGLSFYSKIKTALLIGLIDVEIYKNVESFRKQRNRWIHKYFVKNERPNPYQLYKIASKILDELTKKMQYYLRKA